MADRRVKLLYPTNMVDEPVLYRLIERFGLVANIRQADVNPEGGWLVVDLRGEEDKIDQAIAWVQTLGINVE